MKLADIAKKGIIYSSDLTVRLPLSGEIEDMRVEIDNPISAFVFQPPNLFSQFIITRPYKKDVNNPWLALHYKVKYMRIKDFMKLEPLGKEGMPCDEDFKHTYEFWEQTKSNPAKHVLAVLRHNDRANRLDHKVYNDWIEDGKSIYKVDNTGYSNENLLIDDSISYQLPKRSFIVYLKERWLNPHLIEAFGFAVHENDIHLLMHYKYEGAIIGAIGQTLEFFDRFESWSELRLWALTMEEPQSRELLMFISGALYALVTAKNAPSRSESNKNIIIPSKTFWAPEPQVIDVNSNPPLISSTPVVKRGELDKQYYILTKTTQKEGISIKQANGWTHV